jgi:hypothetical protein
MVRRLKYQKMKIKLTLIITFLLFISYSYGQAKKPSIMIVPSDIYCITNGFATISQGKKYPDYKKALQNDSDLRLVIAKLSQMMLARGFSPKDLEQNLKALENEDADLSVMMSKSSGSFINESPIDILRRTAKADIILDLDFNVKKSGFEKYINFTLRGLDSYTNEIIGSVTGSGVPSSSAQIEILLEEAVLSEIDNFNNQLQSYFNDLFEKGRKIKVVIRVWDSSPIDLEEEYDYDDDYYELAEIIDNWMKQNTKKGMFNTLRSTENTLIYDQVRINIHDEKGRGVDAYDFIKDLRKYLRREPFLITTKKYVKGLGEAGFIIGEK